MTKSFCKLFLAPLTVLALASFALVPIAEARGGGGGGAHAGGGGAAPVAVVARSRWWRRQAGQQ